MSLDAHGISKLLKEAKTVAIVGISNKPDRPSYGVARYLLEYSDYELYFVNPLIEEVLGKKVYKSIGEIPVHIDIVDVFRRPEDCREVLSEAISAGASSIWLQLGIEVPEVDSIGTEAGLQVVMNRCIKIDYAAL